jgi:hypothetical protein
VAPDWVLTNHYTSDAAKMRAVVQDHHARISRAQAVASHQAIYGRIQGMLSAEESASMDARADAARSAAYSQLAAGDYSEGSEDGTTPADRANETEDDMEDGTVQEDDDEIESYGLAPMMDLGSPYYERDVDPIIDRSNPSSQLSAALAFHRCLFCFFYCSSYHTAPLFIPRFSYHTAHLVIPYFLFPLSFSYRTACTCHPPFFLASPFSPFRCIVEFFQLL